MKKRMVLLFGFLLFSLSACDKPATQENVPSPTPILTSEPQPTKGTVPTQPSDREGELQIDVAYHPVVVDGLTEVKAKEGEGIELLFSDGFSGEAYYGGGAQADYGVCSVWRMGQRHGFMWRKYRIGWSIRKGRRTKSLVDFQMCHK